MLKPSFRKNYILKSGAIPAPTTDIRRQRRALDDVKLSDVAARVGCSKTTLSRIERNQYPVADDVKRRWISRIAKALYEIERDRRS